MRFGRGNLPGDGAPFVKGWGAELLEARFEFAAEGLALRAVSGSVDQVGGFRGVGLKIEEFAGPPFAALHILQRLGPQRTHVGVFEEQPIGPLPRRRTAQEACVAAAHAPGIGRRRIDTEISSSVGKKS